MEVVSLRNAVDYQTTLELQLTAGLCWPCYASSPGNQLEIEDFSSPPSYFVLLG